MVEGFLGKRLGSRPGAVEVSEFSLSRLRRYSIRVPSRNPVGK